MTMQHSKLSLDTMHISQLECHGIVTDAIITFRLSRRRCEMYCGHARLCVCLSVCLPRYHYCDDDDDYY